MPRGRVSTEKEIIDNIHNAHLRQKELGIHFNDYEYFKLYNEFLKEYEELTYPSGWKHPKICVVIGCNKKVHYSGKRKDGSDVLKTLCGVHHSIRLLSGDWEYKVYRKNYCENKDGRLGFVCDGTIHDPEWQLTVDHINETHEDNKIENLQTLCHNCHFMKTKSTNGTGKRKGHINE